MSTSIPVTPRFDPIPHHHRQPVKFPLVIRHIPRPTRIFRMHPPPQSTHRPRQIHRRALIWNPRHHHSPGRLMRHRPIHHPACRDHFCIHVVIGIRGMHEQTRVTRTQRHCTNLTGDVGTPDSSTGMERWTDADLNREPIMGVFGKGVSGVSGAYVHRSVPMLLFPLLLVGSGLRSVIILVCV